MSDTTTVQPASIPATRLNSRRPIDGWANKTSSEKTAYMQTRYLPGDQSISLWDCYSRSKKMIAWTELVHMVLDTIRESFTPTTAPSTLKLFSVFVDAFNGGLMQFANIIAVGTNYVIEHGGLSGDGVTDEVENLPTIKDLPIDHDSTMGPQDLLHYLSLAVAFFEDLSDNVERWHSVNPRLGISISSMMVTFVRAGKQFAAAYHSELAK